MFHWNMWRAELWNNCCEWQSGSNNWWFDKFNRVKKWVETWLCGAVASNWWYAMCWNELWWKIMSADISCEISIQDNVESGKIENQRCVAFFGMLLWEGCENKLCILLFIEICRMTLRKLDECCWNSWHYTFKHFWNFGTLHEISHDLHRLFTHIHSKLVQFHHNSHKVATL